MATSTIVITYDAASGEVSTKVTSLTVGGSAFTSLSATEIRLGASLCEQAAKLLRSPAAIDVGGSGTGPENLRDVSVGAGGRD